MTVGLDELRLAAALATAIDGVDVEVRGTGRRWFVSERMPGSPIDVAGFRQLVLATVRGGRLGLLPASRLWVSGALCTLGGGVFRHRDDGLRRTIVTLLDGEHAEAAVAAHVGPAGVDVATTVHVDDELGVCVLSLAATGAMCGRRLDDLAIDVFAACVVEDLVQTVVGESAS